MGRAIADTLERSAGAERVGCRHCGLPTAGDNPWCCIGCEIAGDLKAEAARQETGLRGRLTLSVVLAMCVMGFSLFLYAEDIYDVAAADMGWLRWLSRGLAGLLAAPVMLLCGVPLLRRALRALSQGRLTMELLIASAALAAFTISVAGVVHGEAPVYFDSACVAVVLATFGRYLEASARAQASGAIAPLLDLAARPIDASRDGVQYAPCAPAQLEAGMWVRCQPEHALPVDVTVVGEGCVVDCRVVSGEAEAVTVAVGGEVPAGGVPIDRALVARVLRPAHQSMLARLAALAKEMQADRTRLVRLADGFAAALTPLVWLIALGALAYWAQHGSLGAGINVALAVVLVACPCTYGVATPLILWLTLRRALAEDVLLRTPDTIETLAQTDAVAFDKTGTLTEPVITSDASPAELSLVAGLEGGSPHPIARALLALAQGVSVAAVAERTFVAGRGVVGQDEQGRSLALGSPSLMAQTGVDASGLGPGDLGLACDGRLVARFHWIERLRDEALPALTDLRALGLRATVLTGDNSARGELVGSALHLPVQAGLTASDKATRLRALGRHVAMVGDGLNDTPALAGAATGIAVSEGSDLARALAPVVLLRSDLRLVPWSIALARRATRLVRQLLVWSTVYNAGFLALAAGGLLRPVFAGGSMLVSSLLVVAAALRVSAWPGPVYTSGASA